MKLPYIDLHTHSNVSDGCLPPRELIARSRAAGVGILALTDHNSTADLTALREEFPDMTLLQGSEVTCRYNASDGNSHELHVVALGFDPDHPKMREIFRRNQPDRRPYITAILEKLAALGIDVGTYDELQAANPDSRHFGRMQIAQEMKNRGYVDSVNEAFDVYMGAHGERRAYVANPLRYVSLEEAVDAILSAGGVAVLAHLYYYLMDDARSRELLQTFKTLTGDRGAMEVHYGAYTQEQRRALGALAAEFDLMPSCASDYHGNMDGETLAHGFDAEICRPILEKLGVA